MIEKVSNKVLYFLSKDLSLDNDKKEVLLFGITRIVEDIPKTVGLVLIGVVLRILPEMMIVTAMLILYKTFVGGVHAKTNLGCFLSSAMFYLAIIYLSKLVVIGNEYFALYLALNYIFAIYCIWVYVPADVPEIPKVNENLRKQLKLKAFVMLNIIFALVVLLVKDSYIQRIILFSVFFINLMTTRVIYKIFGNQYGFETYFPYD